MPSPSDPLLLWCSSHESLAAEEIPLFLEAGFRVVPLHTNFWTQAYDPSLDDSICPAWRESVALPPDVVRRLQAVKICQPDKHRHSPPTTSRCWRPTSTPSTSPCFQTSRSGSQPSFRAP